MPRPSVRAFILKIEEQTQTSNINELFAVSSSQLAVKAKAVRGSSLVVKD